MSDRIALTLEYLGQAYNGWQRQAHDGQTIQQAVEYAIGMIAQHRVTVVCAGRTDSGVHALQQVIHFDTSTERHYDNWLRGVNYYLPDDIAVTQVAQVGDDFHARFSACSRSYYYVFDRSPTPPAIMRNRVTGYNEPLDLVRMHQASQLLLGEHDFRSFQGRSCQASNTYRYVHEAQWFEKGPYLIFYIKANAFLHHMVRYLVGAMVAVGTHHQPLSWLESLLANPDRQSRKHRVPAQGLYLAQVEYPSHFARLLATDYSPGERLLPGLLN